ncbi:MAG: TspO/MBR family protein [Candidatus Korobacteraceae bacterium]
MQRPGRSKTLLALGAFGAAVAAAGWFGSRNSPKDVRTRLWYKRLDKPSFNPPEFVFPVVWTSLYALMAISGWRVWQTEDSGERSRALRLWVGQLSSNAEWTTLFFGQHRPKRALVDIVVLETMIVKYISAADKVDRTAALCFVPYAAWVAFAAVLNFEIARRNPDAHKKFPRPRVA